MTTPEGLRTLNDADVYKGARLAATLTRDGDAVVFQYEEGYLADPLAPDVSHTLPRTTVRVTATAGSVPAFFAGLLPEGVRLRAIATGTRTSEDDHFTLLLAVGQDTIGDVRVVPRGQALQLPSPVFDDTTTQPDLSDVFASATSTRLDELDRIALPGVQVKVSAELISTPVRTARGPAILKLNPPDDYPRLVENEEFFLSMAADCGLEVPKHTIVADKRGRTGLVVSRFDRIPGTDGEPTPLAQEDACQLLGVYPAAKYRLKTETVARAVADAVAAGDGSRQLALRRVIGLVAFSYLIGNGDLHGKNFSVRQTPAGFWEVTPVYDLLTTQPYLNWNDPMALNFYGRANRLNRAHLTEAGERLGLPSAAVASALDRICDAAPAWIDRLDEIGFDDAATERLADMMRHRATELGRS